MSDDYELVANIVVMREETKGKTSYDTFFNVKNADYEQIKRKLMSLNPQGGDVFRINGYGFPLLVMYVQDDEYPSPIDVRLRIKERTFYCMEAWQVEDKAMYLPIDWLE